MAIVHDAHSVATEAWSMVVSEFQLLIVLQLMLVLLGGNFFFWLNQRRQGNFVDKLKDKVKELKEAKPPPPPAIKNVISSSMEMVGFDLELAIEETIKHFDEIGVPIVPKLKPELAQFQLALLLRLEVLQLEKAALEIPADAPKRKWQFLESKLGDMVAKLKSKPKYKDIAQEGKRNDVVDAFNETLGVLQPEWIQYQQDTGQLHPDLLNIIIQSGDAQGISSWADMFSSQAKANAAEKSTSPEFSMNFDINATSQADLVAIMGDNSATVDMLTNIAKEQAQAIAGLKSQLVQLEIMDVDVSEYTEQIERFERLMTESETVVKMLERELNEATQRIQELEQQAPAVSASIQSYDSFSSNNDNITLFDEEPDPAAPAPVSDSSAELSEAKGLILKFAQDSMMYLKAIAKLEKEKSALSAENFRLQEGAQFGGDNNDDQLSSRVAELEWEYVELERRFLAAYDTLRRIQRPVEWIEIN